MPKFTRISYSHLSALSCPYQAFLRYEGKIRAKPTHYLALGNSLHLALEKTYTPNGLLTLDGAHEVFLTDFRRQIEEEEIFVSYPQVKKAESDGAKMLAKFFSQLDKGEISKTPIAVEQSFKLELSGIEIVGKIDRIDETSEGLVVSDYKSGSAKPNEWFLRHNLQLTAYYWAAKQIYGVTPAKVVWHHLRDGKRLESERTDWDIEQLVRIVDAAIAMQDADIRYRVYNDKICGYCDYSPPSGNQCDDKELEQTLLEARV